VRQAFCAFLATIRLRIAHAPPPLAFAVSLERPRDGHDSRARPGIADSDHP